MFTYPSLAKRLRVFQRMTGLTLEEFTDLLDKFKSGWQLFVASEFLSKERKRRFGGGRHSRLHTPEDKLLFILVYTRIYPLMIVQGLFFGFEDSRACQWVHRLLPILDQAMEFTHTRPKRGHGRSLEEILAAIDTGFIGLKVGRLKIVISKKKPKLQKLSESDKAQNRAISSIRVTAEHAICGAKRNRSVSDIYRNFSQDFDDLLMSVACGLHNFRVIHRQAS